MTHMQPSRGLIRRCRLLARRALARSLYTSACGFGATARGEYGSAREWFAIAELYQTASRKLRAAADELASKRGDQ